MSAPAPRRLRVQPGEVIDRRTPVGFRWDRTPMTGFRGDSIVSAVSAHGTRVFSKSSPFTRARGFVTIEADDPHCLVRVDGEWNVRAGRRLVTDGMEIERQTPWPAERTGPFDPTGPTSRLPTSLVSKLTTGPMLPVYRRLRDRLGSGAQSETTLGPARYGRRAVHVDVLVVGGGPAGLSASVAASTEGASVLLVDEHHFLGTHLRWGDEVDRSMLNDLVRAVDAAEGIEVLLGASLVGSYEDGWCALSQQHVDGLDEHLTLVRAGAIVETAELIAATGTFEGADRTGVISAEAARMLVNLYAVAPGDRVVILGGTSEADAARHDLLNVGIDVVHFLDPDAGQTISSVAGSKKSLGVTVSDGSRVEADLVVVGQRWAHKPGNVGSSALRTGRGVVGPPTRGARQHEQLIAHGVATGRLAARQAAVVHHRIRQLTPRAVPPEGGEPAWPTDNRSAQEHPVLEQSGPGLGLAPSLGALATETVRPLQQSAIQPWHEQQGGVQTIANGWIRTDHYGSPADEVRRARASVGAHDMTPLGTFVLNGTQAGELLASLSPQWVDLQSGRVRSGSVRSGTVAVAGRLSTDMFVVTATIESSDGLGRQMGRWLSGQPSGLDVSLELLTAGYTGIRITGPHATEVLSRLSDGIVRDIPAGHLDRVWLVGVADCILWRLDLETEPSYELHVPAGYGLHVWEQIFEVGADLGVTPIGFEADRIMSLE